VVDDIAVADAVVVPEGVVYPLISVTRGGAEVITERTNASRISLLLLKGILLCFLYLYSSLS